MRIEEEGIKRIAAINSETKVIKKEGQKVEEEDKLIVKDMGAESEGDKTDYLSQLVNECRIDAEESSPLTLKDIHYWERIISLLSHRGRIDIPMLTLQMMNRFREDTSVTSHPHQCHMGKRRG